MESKISAHPRHLSVGAYFADPDSFAPDPVMLRVTQRHGDLHVTVHNGDTGRTYDMWFSDTDRVHHLIRP